MKKFYALCVVIAALIAGVVVTSCGSQWEITGNNMTIIKVQNDTIAPAGSFIMLPDSALSQSK